MICSIKGRGAPCIKTDRLKTLAMESKTGLRGNLDGAAGLGQKIR
jgi:hypothetical protein